MNTNTYLSEFCINNNISIENTQFPDCEIDPNKIKVIMISEVPPVNRDDYFYSGTENPDYMKTTLQLFLNAGVDVHSMQDILELGIYITTAVKSPKTEYTVNPDLIKAHLPILKAELSMFPHLQVIMLMGDVAKKAVNIITKSELKKNLIPSDATGRIRHNEYYWGSIRVFPSYIMTGKNLLIEKFKRDCVSDDISRMMNVLK